MALKEGIVYVAWGEKVLDELEQSRLSAAKFGYPICLITDEETKVDESRYDFIIRHKFDHRLKGLCRKSVIYDLSPFETTLFLDTDTVVFYNIDYGFDRARRYGMCLSFAPVFVLDKTNAVCDDGAVIYNTGVIFFDKNKEVKKVFDGWKHLCELHDTDNDQPLFCVSVDLNQFNPHTLPHTWNFRAQFSERNLHINGPLRIWHSRQPVPKNIVEYNRQWREARGFAFYQMKKEGEDFVGEIKYKIEPKDDPFDWHKIWKSPLEYLDED